MTSPSLYQRAFHKFEKVVLSPQVRVSLFKARNGKKEKFICPICSYVGPFMDLHARTGFRAHAQCPQCESMERHRLQKLVQNHLSSRMNWAQLSMLHIAPEGFFQQTFRTSFRKYDTADLEMPGVDFHVDLCGLPFEDASYDVVYASHVLHHIANDMAALSEICRVLKPGGFAVLPVPIIASTTIEYPQANPNEHYFWRAPGRDYFNKYRRVFSRVDEYDSGHFVPVHQTYLHEDRTIWPTPGTIWRRAMPGTRHAEVVPVCYK